MKRVRLRWWMLLVTVAALLGSAFAQAGPGDHADLLVFKGAVTPVLDRYLSHGITTASQDGAEVLILKLDTPGGSVDITQGIVQKILASPVPVVVYVAPPGAHAASAGTFITLAAHVAVMAPGTTIGAASPVSNEGTDLGKTMQKKVTNVLAKDLANLAKRRGEKAEKWAEDAVREAKASTAEEALELGVVDAVADDVPDLLDKIDGFQVKVNGTERTLKTRGIPIRKIPMSPLDKFLNAITNPTIAAILLTLGLNGLLFELASPGAYLPGIIGVISLLLAFYSLGALSANYVGLIFIALAFILFVVDLKAPTHGILTIGGIVSFIFGAMVLFNTPYTTVPWATIITLSLGTAAFFVYAIAKVIQSYRWKPVTGKEGLLGSIGEARTDLNPTGMVFVQGETWRAVAEDPPIPRGTPVVVTAVRGLKIVVQRAQESERE